MLQNFNCLGIAICFNSKYLRYKCNNLVKEDNTTCENCNETIILLDKIKEQQNKILKNFI